MSTLPLALALCCFCSRESAISSTVSRIGTKLSLDASESVSHALSARRRRYVDDVRCRSVDKPMPRDTGRKSKKHDGLFDSTTVRAARGGVSFVWCKVRCAR